MFPYSQTFKQSIMSKTIYILSTRPHQGTPDEINKCTATSLTEAINIFAATKRLRPDQLLKIYQVYEQRTDGKRRN